MPIPESVDTLAPRDGGEPRSWRRTAARYRTSRTRDGVMQLCTTIPPFLGLLWLMHWSLGYSYWVTLALAFPTAGFLVRTFIIMHDCSHGSFLPHRRANEIIGFITGVLTLTPFAKWRRDHALHHASSGDLDRRGHGDVMTLTVEEYRARSRWGRFQYRVYRNPLVLFGLGPLWLMINQRWVATTAETSPLERTSVRATNAAILGIIVVLSVIVGLPHVLLVYVPVFLLGGSAGIWLFYVQHQFEDTYWQGHTGWEHAEAALKGSSYYRLPRVLEWITGNIGLHHVHHIDPRIPNYNLRRCHDENREFHEVTILSLRDSLHTTSLKLWDSKRERLVGFKEAGV
jgi:omega-6 fatty acid desaturase (delta-12 desaturase)